VIRSHIAPHPPVPIVGAGTLSSALTGPKAPPLYHHAYPLSLPLSRESLRLTGHPIFIRHHTLNRPRARVVFQCAYSDILRRVPPSELSLLSYFSQPPAPISLSCVHAREIRRISPARRREIQRRKSTTRNASKSRRCEASTNSCCISHQSSAQMYTFCHSALTHSLGHALNSSTQRCPLPSCTHSQAIIHLGAYSASVCARVSDAWGGQIFPAPPSSFTTVQACRGTQTKDLVLVAGPSDLALFLGNLKNLVLEKLL